MFGGSDIFVLIVVFPTLLTVFLGVKTLPQGYNWTVERFGPLHGNAEARP
jgi:regulator of protease activity HflC (stomatin/prohibitin superfamily)